MNYGEILKKAFILTFRYPLLWVYGFFVVGTFNVNFVYFQGLDGQDLNKGVALREQLFFFQQHPGQVLGWTALILAAALVGLLVTNWARILLVASTKRILDNEPLVFKELVEQTKKVQKPVIGISLITTALIVIVAAVLLVPPLWARELQREIVLWGVSIVTFLPLSFALCLINIFGAFYAILYKTGLGKSLNLGTDFFIANWTRVLAMLAVLVILYMAVFGLGAGVNYFIIASLPLVASPLGFLKISAIILLLRGLSLLIFWLFLAVLNVLFNTVLLLLFLELQKPLKHHGVKERAVSPAVT